MVFPPPTLPVDQNNTTASRDKHAADHNAVSSGLNDITAQINARVAVRKQYQNAGSINSGTWTQCVIGTMEYTYGSDISGDASGITVTRGGLYLAIPHLIWVGGNGANRRGIGVSIVAAAAPLGSQQDFDAGIATVNQHQGCVIPFYIPSDSVFPVRFIPWAYQDSGAVMTLVHRKLTIVRLAQEF